MTINPERNKKKCSLCKTVKIRDQFYSDKSRADGLSAYCKLCSSQRNKKWREKNPEKSSESSLWTRRKIFYGIDKNKFYELIEKQQGLCAICKKDIDKSAHVDHCHKNGTVRGLLCRNCNNGLGLFNDDINHLQNAINYLTFSSN